MHYAMDDAGFWGRVPRQFDAVKETAHGLGMKVSYFVMGSQDDDDAPVAVAVQMRPGLAIPRHLHDCERFEVLVRGTLLAGGRILVPGDVMTSRRNELYGPHTAGPDGATTIEVFGSLRSTGVISYETQDGQLVTVDFAAGDQRPNNIVTA